MPTSSFPSSVERRSAVYLEKAGSELCWRIAEQCNEMSMSEEAIAGSSCLCGFEKQQLSEWRHLTREEQLWALGATYMSKCVCVHTHRGGDLSDHRTSARSRPSGIRLGLPLGLLIRPPPLLHYKEAGEPHS